MIGSITSWMEQGVAFHFANDREAAEQFAARLLFMSVRRRWRELRGLLADIEQGEETDTEPRQKRSPNAVNAIETNSFYPPVGDEVVA